MPWNGSAPNQTFARSNGDNTGTNTWADDEAEGFDILASRHDAHDQDLSDGIDACLKKDGGNAASADIPMGGFALTNLAACGALTESVRGQDIKHQSLHYYPSVGGTADAITLAGSGVAITAYAAGQRFSFLNTSGPNTGAATVNVDSVGAKNIRRNDGSATALSAADMPDNALCQIEYDGTQFLLLSPAQPGADLAAIEALSGTGVAARTGTNTWALNQLETTLNFCRDTGNSAVALDTGILGDMQIDFACTIVSCTMLADQSGSAVVDVWKDTYANYPPTNADSITASANPTISGSTKSTDSTLTGWTTSISAGDILRFNLDSVTSISRLTITLKVKRYT